jgi:uncharacterized sporulation protein YeaH/YhbH (DUF444 family)
MSMFLLVLAFLLIGVPGTVFVVLQLMSAHRRQALAYRWSASEIQRRGARIVEMERATANDRKSIGELMMKISTLRMTVDRLEKLIEQSGKPAAAATKK